MANNIESLKGGISIGVVVLNWQRFDDTVACLQSLQSLELTSPLELELEVYVCDNNSQDGSAEKLSSWVSNNSNFKFVPTGANGGYAFGNNVGIRYLEDSSSPEFIWLLNNDTLVEQNCLQELVSFAISKPQLKIIGSTVVDYVDKTTVQCCGGYTYVPWSTRLKGVCEGQALSQVPTSSRDVSLDYISGASMFCRADVFREFGLLTEDYFLYYEEHDFTKRIGGKTLIGWCPSSVVYHKGAGSTSSSGQRRSITQQYYENLSTFKFTYRFFRQFLLLVIGTRLMAKPLLFTLRREWHLFGPFFAAIKDFVVWQRQDSQQGM